LATVLDHNYLAYARLYIHKLHSENLLDIRGGILT